MRATDFIVENYSTNLSLKELRIILDAVKTEAEDIDDISMMSNISKEKHAALEKDYRALTAISNVVSNNIKAVIKAKEDPAIFDTNIFMYDWDNDVDNGVAAIHVFLDKNVAEIKWLGSYGTFGSKLMKSALDVAKSRGSTQVKVDAKWGSEGFYRKMGLDQDTTAEPDRGEAFRDSNLTPFTGKLEED